MRARPIAKLHHRPAIHLLAAFVATLLAIIAPTAHAAYVAPWWRLDVTAAPSLVPANGEVQLVVSANNLGDASAQGSTETPFTITDTLPDGLTPVGSVETLGPLNGCGISGQIVTCTGTHAVLPYEQLGMRIIAHATLTAPVPSSLSDSVQVVGGGVPAASATKQLHVGPAGDATPFGVETFQLRPEGEAGTPATKAGSHPFQLTTAVDFNQTLGEYSSPTEKGIFPSAPALPRNLHFTLPPGLVGFPEAVPRCTETQFTTLIGGPANLCPNDTAVGVATLAANIPTPLGFSILSVPVFNLEPGPGEPARFGFDVKNVPVILRTAIPSGGEYRVRVSVEYAPETAQLLSSQVTLWGVPDDPRHDSARGWECLDGGKLSKEVPCQPDDETAPKAFLTLPTSCAVLSPATVTGDSWPAGSEHPSESIQPGPGAQASLPTLAGCTSLRFAPSLDVQPETSASSTPTGLDATVTMPQQGLTAGEGAAEPALRETTVTLPEGLELNPSAANALGVCPAIAFGFEGTPEDAQTLNSSFSEDPAVCPNTSKVGTASIETPLLPGQQIQGALYLAEQNVNPFKAPLALYLVAEDAVKGIRVKLAGSVTPEPNGQLVSTFQNTPQLPFGSLRLHFFGGERASVSTPAKCGGYRAQAEFTGWSGEVVTPGSEPAFQVTTPSGGGGCPGTTLPFSPSFTAGADDPQAAAFTRFTVTVGHADSDQPLERVQVHLPAGIAALISQVTPCPQAQALTDACGPESVVGHTTATAGLGGEPITLPGLLYLTGPLSATSDHPAAPFGLLAVTHAVAGPFNLGSIPVVSTLEVDPSTAAVTVSSEPIPKLIDGVPTDLKQLIVTVERPGNEPFEFNPTSCNPLTIDGILTGYEDARSEQFFPFQATGCANLPFAPVLTARTAGTASKLNGTSLDVKVTSPGLGQANIAKVALQLPAALPSRLTTIQKACPDSIFNTNPAGCDEGSLVGKATVHTPVLNSPLTGPAYLVSHGGAAFPDIEFVLQGEGITLILDGKTDIKGGITYTRFEAAPDAPFTSFETELPAGPHSALAAYVGGKTPYDLCNTTLTMPTTITAQNGAHTTQQTKITPTGCGAVKAYKTTRQQQLKKALNACRKKYKHHHTKRAKCEKQARQRYTTRRPANTAKKTPGHTPQR